MCDGGVSSAGWTTPRELTPLLLPGPRLPAIEPRTSTDAYVTLHNSTNTLVLPYITLQIRLCYLTLLYKYACVTLHYSTNTLVLPYITLQICLCYLTLLYQYACVTLHYSTNMLVLPYITLPIRLCYLTLLYQYARVTNTLNMLLS
jgi:hypothetical protein